MKKSILELGKVLSNLEQQKVTGGYIEWICDEDGLCCAKDDENNCYYER